MLTPSPFARARGDVPLPTPTLPHLTLPPVAHPPPAHARVTPRPAPLTAGAGGREQGAYPFLLVVPGSASDSRMSGEEGWSGGRGCGRAPSCSVPSGVVPGPRVLFAHEQGGKGGGWGHTFPAPLACTVPAATRLRVSEDGGGGGKDGGVPHPHPPACTWGWGRKKKGGGGANPSCTAPPFARSRGRASKGGCPPHGPTFACPVRT